MVNVTDLVCEDAGASIVAPVLIVSIDEVGWLGTFAVVKLKIATFAAICSGLSPAPSVTSPLVSTLRLPSLSSLHQFLDGRAYQMP